MPDKDHFPKINPSEKSRGQNIEKGVHIDLNESRLPDFEHATPAPSTPPPPTVDKTGSENTAE